MLWPQWHPSWSWRADAALNHSNLCSKYALLLRIPIDSDLSPRWSSIPFPSVDWREDQVKGEGGSSQGREIQVGEGGSSGGGRMKLEE